MEGIVITCMRYCVVAFLKNIFFLLIFLFKWGNITLEILQVSINEIQYGEASQKLAALLADPDVEVSILINNLTICVCMGEDQVTSFNNIPCIY